MKETICRTNLQLSAHQIPAASPKYSTKHPDITFGISLNTPTTPGTPVQDEPSTRTTPQLAQVTARLEKHAQVENMDSFIPNKDLTTHPDLADYVNLCSDNDSDHELEEPAGKYPRRSLSAETTPSSTPSTMPTDCSLPSGSIAWIPPCIHRYPSSGCQSETCRFLL